jgi:hypothetical protein
MCVDTVRTTRRFQGITFHACVPLCAGVLVGCYESTRFKSKVKPSKLQGVTLLGLGSGAEESVKAGAAVAAGNFLTRSVQGQLGGGAGDDAGDGAGAGALFTQELHWDCGGAWAGLRKHGVHLLVLTGEHACVCTCLSASGFLARPLSVSVACMVLLPHGSFKRSITHTSRLHITRTIRLIGHCCA